MYISRVKISNLGPFRGVKEWNLGKWLVGVFGKNGQGKSSLLNAIYAAITNDFSRFRTTKDKCVTDKPEPPGAAYVEVDVEHEGHAFTIKRSIVPAGSKLTIRDGETITNSNKIAEELAKMIGYDLRVLDVCVFKEQDRIYDVISDAPGDRALAFQRLCRTENCEVIHRALVEVLGSIDTGERFDDTSDELRDQLRDVDSRLQAARRIVEEWTPKIPSEKTMQTVAQIFAAARAAKEWRNKVQRAEEQLESARKTREELRRGWVKVEQKDIDELGEQIEEQAAVVSKLERVLEEVRAQIKQKQAAEAKVREAVAALEESKEKHRRAEKELAVVVENPPACVPAAIAKLAKTDEKKVMEKLSELEHELTGSAAELREQRSGFERLLNRSQTLEDNSECPTCGAKYTPPTAAKVREWQAAVEKLEAQREQVLRDKAAVASWRMRLHTVFVDHRVFSQLAQSTHLVKDAKAELAKLKNVPDAYDAAPISKAKAELDLLRKQRSELRETLAQQTAQDAKAVQQEARAKAELDTAKTELADAEANASEERMEWAQARHDLHADALTKVVAAEATVTTLETQKRGLSAQLDALEARVQRMVGLRKDAELLDQAKDLFHRSGIPAAVATANLTILQHSVNQVLASFGSPFWVEAGDDLDFIVHRSGAAPRSANQLSTGQRVVLAVALWLSVAPALGLLVLDEPTANLDDENKTFLAETLAGLSDTLKGARQIIMVSHEDSLRPSFNQIIDLGV